VIPAAKIIFFIINKAEAANGGSGGCRYVALLLAVVYIREPIFS
jgi:hypothetical protein